MKLFFDVSGIILNMLFYFSIVFCSLFVPIKFNLPINNWFFPLYLVLILIFIVLWDIKSMLSNYMIKNRSII